MLVILLVIVILFVLIGAVNVIEGLRIFKKVRLLEKNKDYEGAAICYAQCIVNNAIFGSVNNQCSKKIKYLWDKHGPFKYAGIYQEMRELKEKGDDWEGSYFSVLPAIQIIEKIVNTKITQEV